MFSFIERLQRKPRAARIRIAFAAAFIATALLALWWFAGLPSRLALSLPAAENDVAEIAAPLHILGDNIADAFRAATEATGQRNESAPSEPGAGE